MDDNVALEPPLGFIEEQKEEHFANIDDMCNKAKERY